MSGLEIIILIVILGLIFDYTNGFHDAANVISTVIATKALRPISAILMAGVLNTFGATQISGVAHTISSGLVDPHASSQLMVLCALFGAIIWNIATWYFGLPSSSSYALIGGLLGAAYFQAGPQIIIWNGLIYKVIIPMVVSPLVGFGLALAFMKGLYCLKQTPKREKLFRHLQIGSAGLVALSHGLNDAQKSMGVITLGLFAANLIPDTQIPFWVILACALVMGLGTATGGFRIVRTMGYKITKLQPIQGFAAEMGSGLVILSASIMGMPLSSTQLIAGSISGVGAAKGSHFVRWSLIRKIIITWILTLPGSALVSYLFYYFLIKFALV